MRISYNWLKDYLDIKQTSDELAHDLSLFGFAAESMEKVNSDTILDLEINPNRGDCLSILGIAREIAAMDDLKIKLPKYEITENKINQKIDVKISDPQICPRFTARVIDNITIEPSPDWLKERLTSYGFRPINNIVDITNYVMLSCGQPLHAFDWQKIKDGEMEVSQAKEGEEMFTLDGQNRKLPAGTIIIRDKEKIYDLAGIMGGLKSEVDKNTKTIVLQGAIFNPVLIRRTSKILSHVTDASYRYERGVDPEGTIFGLDMAASLIKKLCPKAKIGSLVDENPGTQQNPEIKLDLAKVSSLLGLEITAEKAEEILAKLNFASRLEDSQLAVQVPSYRIYDVKIWQDLAEEIARIYGYNKISEKKLESTKSAVKNPDWQKREFIKDEIKKIGFTESHSPTFVDKKQIEILGFNLADCQEILNPLSLETQYLTPSLLPSLLGQIAKNPWAPEIALFEIGKVFQKGEEFWQVGLAVSGNLGRYLDEVLEKLALKKEIVSVDQKILNFYKIRRQIKVVTINLSEINLPEREINDKFSEYQYREISKYPPTVRDLSFIVKSNIDADKIKDAIQSVSSKIFLIELFDEFSSDKLGQGKKNLAYHIWLEDLERPVSESDANGMIENIIKTIENKFHAKLRS